MPKTTSNGKKKEAEKPGFTLEPLAMQKALRHVVRAVDSKPQIPVLGNIRLRASKEAGEIELAGTNLGLTVVTRFPCASITEDWMTTLPSKHANDLISSMNPLTEANFTYARDEEKTYVKQGLLKFNLSGISADEFPAVEEISGERTFLLPVEPFCEALRATMYAAESDVSKVALTGVVFYFREHTLTMMATDTQRVGWAEVDLGDNMFIDYSALEPFAMPARLLREIESMFSSNEGSIKFSIGTTENGAERAVFEAGNLTAQVMLLAEFHDRLDAVMSYLGELPIEAEVRLATLKTILKRTSIFAADNNNLCVLKFGAKGIEVSSRSPERGEVVDEIEGEMSEGAQLSIGQHVRLVLEALEPFEESRFITIKGKAENWMLHFSSKEKEGIYAATSPMSINTKAQEQKATAAAVQVKEEDE